MYRQSMRVNQAVKRKLSCCQKLSRNWLLTLNTIVGLLGGFLLGFTITNSVQQGDAIEALGENGLLGASIAAGVLIFAGTLGCCGVIYKNKFVLIIYLLLTMALGTAFIGVGVLFTFLVDDLANIDGADAEDLSGTVEGRLNDFLIAVFNECCGENFGFDKLLGCGEDGADLDACFTFEGTYEAALDRVRNTGLCKTLENIEVEIDVGVVVEVPIVGSEEDQGCALGDGALFKQLLTDEFEDILKPIGIVFLVTGAILMVTNIATCFLLCAKQDEYIQKNSVYKRQDPVIEDNLGTLPALNTYSSNYAQNPIYGKGAVNAQY